MSDKVSPNRQPNRKRRKKKAVSTQISAPYSCIGVHKPLAACSRPELKQIALSVEVSRTGNKKDLIERIKPKLEQKLSAHRDLVKSRLAPLVAISGKRFLLLAKQHSVPVEPVTFQFVRRNGVSADTLYKLGAKEHGDLMDQMEMSYNTYRSFIDFCFDIRDGEVVINVASANVEEEKQIGISEIGVLNDLNQINQLNDGNGISEIDIVNQNINENINANAIEMQNVLSQLQERQPGAILKHTYVQPPPQPPTIPALPLPPLPLPPLPLPPPPPHDVGDVANDDPVWDSMLSVGMNTILCLPPPKYKATFKNKLARQALVGPTRVVEFSKFDQIKEKDKLNSILKILIPTGYCPYLHNSKFHHWGRCLMSTKDAPPKMVRDAFDLCFSKIEEYTPKEKVKLTKRLMIEYFEKQFMDGQYQIIEWNCYRKLIRVNSGAESKNNDIVNCCGVHNPLYPFLERLKRFSALNVIKWKQLDELGFQRKRSVAEHIKQLTLEKLWGLIHKKEIDLWSYLEGIAMCYDMKWNSFDKQFGSVASEEKID